MNLSKLETRNSELGTRNFRSCAWFTSSAAPSNINRKSYPIASAFRAQDLIKRAFDDIDPARLVDHHTHIAGIGTGPSGAFINPKMRSWAHPFHHLKFKVYLSAAGVADVAHADAQLVDRLVNLIKHISGHGKHRLLAFDKNYRPDGTPNLEKTEFYVPNDYVFELAEQYPDLFIPNISVNPYRPDALEELERCARRGARMLKWLPNAMGINPADPKCDRFYQKMKELDLVLLSHGGEEKAVEAAEDQKLGNPTPAAASARSWRQSYRGALCRAW